MSRAHAPHGLIHRSNGACGIWPTSAFGWLSYSLDGKPAQNSTFGDSGYAGRDGIISHSVGICDAVFASWLILPLLRPWSQKNRSVRESKMPTRKAKKTQKKGNLKTTRRRCSIYCWLVSNRQVFYSFKSPLTGCEEISKNESY